MLALGLVSSPDGPELCPFGRGRNRLGSNNMFAEWVHMGQKAEPGLQKQKPIWFPAPLRGAGNPRWDSPPRAGADGEAEATAGPWAQVRDVDGAQGVTAKAGDEADGGQKRGSREKEIANYTTTIRQL